MTTAGDGLFFRVDCSRLVLQQLKQILNRAIVKGTGAGLLAAVRALHDRLSQDPKGFGEALYRLPVLRLEVYVGIVAPLVVHYAVHEAKPLVVVRGFNELRS